MLICGDRVAVKGDEGARAGERDRVDGGKEYEGAQDVVSARGAMTRGSCQCIFGSGKERKCEEAE